MVRLIADIRSFGVSATALRRHCCRSARLRRSQNRSFAGPAGEGPHIAAGIRRNVRSFPHLPA